MKSLGVYAPKCLISGNLVYVANLKCASTFFYHNFRRAGWSEIEFPDVRVNQHQIFGHLLDPWLRRAKGHAEFLYMNFMCREFQQDPRIQKLALNTLMGDYHSASYCSYLGDKIWCIDWIPLNAHHDQVIAHTELLLQYHGKKVPEWDRTAEHRSPQIQIDCTTRLLHLLTDEAARHRLGQEVRWYNIYRSVQDPSWPPCDWIDDAANLSDEIKQELCSMSVIQENFSWCSQNQTFSPLAHCVDDTMVIFNRITRKYLESDIKLYRTVVENFDPGRSTWDKISWLSDLTT